MKLLILLIVIACGHKEPPPKDVADSDGDHILNYQESELSRYVAETVPFGDVKATLSFKNDTRPVAIELSNNSDQRMNAFKLLTKSASTLKLEDYFSEWSALHLITPSAEKISELQYDVAMTVVTEEKAGAIVLRDGKGEIVIAPFSPKMRFQLTGEELRSILSGDASLTLRRSGHDHTSSAETTVRERTYRVFLFDGHVGKIHYVSREIPLEKYMSLLGIHESSDISSFRGFTAKETENLWWYRSLGENDKVVVYASSNYLSQIHQTYFAKSTQVISRVNGKQSQVLQVRKRPETKFVLKLRGSRTQNSFREFTKKWHMGGGHGEISEDCRTLNREISRTQSFPFTRDFLKEIHVQDKEHVFTLQDLSAHITEASDENGIYYELTLDATPDDFTVRIPDRPASTFTMTGAYYTECIDITRGGTPTNEEGQLVLSVESFIEKID